MYIPPAADRSARLNMRIAPDALETIREAAIAQQQDVTSFVLGAAMERARAILLEEHALRVTPAEAAQLDEALDEEPWEIPELAELVREVEAQRKYAGRLRPRRPPAP